MAPVMTGKQMEVWSHSLKHWVLGDVVRYRAGRNGFTALVQYPVPGVGLCRKRVRAAWKHASSGVEREQDPNMFVARQTQGGDVCAPQRGCSPALSRDVALQKNAELCSSVSGEAYTLSAKIGEGGGFGQVWTCTAGGKTLAVKVARLCNPEDCRAPFCEADKFRVAASCVGSSFVPDLIESADATLSFQGQTGRDHYFIMAMEHVDGCSAAGFRETSCDMVERAARAILFDVFLALSYLHEAGIIHRDVKTENILVSRSGTSRLCDFGSSIVKEGSRAAREVDPALHKLQRENRSMTVVGTPIYMAPEMCAGAARDEKVDVWPMGVIMLEFALGLEPVELIDYDPTVSQLNQPVPTVPELPDHSSSYKSITQSCLTLAAARRPSARDILRGGYFNSDDSDQSRASVQQIISCHDARMQARCRG